MSITFRIEANPTGRFVLSECAATRRVVAGSFTSYDAALAGVAAHQVDCTECAAYGLFAVAVFDVGAELDLNLANLNARTVLAMLGLEVGAEGFGRHDASDFLARVLLALASDFDDSGVVPVRQGNMIECGLRPGYYADRFGALYTLATEAVRLGRDIVWD